MQTELHKANENYLEEKKKRRVDVAAEVEKRKAVESTVGELYDFIDELYDEIAEARTDVRMANKHINATKKSKSKADTIAQKRLDLLNDLKLRFNNVKDMLIDETKEREALSRLQHIKLEIKKEKNIGRRGEASRWPVHIVLLICEMLVNGTPPTAVPANLQSTQAAFVGIEAKELPSVNFVRQCRTVLQNLNETLSALRLGRAENWYQLFTDGTSRRQIAFQNMVIALMEDGTLDPVIVSSCMVVEDETSDMQVKSILDTVSFGSCISLCLFLFHI